MKDDSKNWFVSTSELDGQEVITRGRRHMGEVIESGLFTERVEIEWSYKPLPGGMPTEEQDKKMNQVAFELADALESDEIAFLTAIYTGREKFFMIFYTCNIDLFAQTLHLVLDKYEQLPIQIGRTEDTHWSDYKEMLKQNGMVE